MLKWVSGTVNTLLKWQNASEGTINGPASGQNTTFTSEIAPATGFLYNQATLKQSSAAGASLVGSKRSVSQREPEIHVQTKENSLLCENIQPNKKQCADALLLDTSRSILQSAKKLRRLNRPEDLYTPLKLINKHTAQATQSAAPAWRKNKQLENQFSRPVQGLPAANDLAMGMAITAAGPIGRFPASIRSPYSSKQQKPVDGASWRWTASAAFPLHNVTPLRSKPPRTKERQWQVSDDEGWNDDMLITEAPSTFQLTGPAPASSQVPSISMGSMRPSQSSTSTTANASVSNMSAQPSSLQLTKDETTTSAPDKTSKSLFTIPSQPTAASGPSTAAQPSQQDAGTGPVFGDPSARGIASTEGGKSATEPNQPSTSLPSFVSAFPAASSGATLPTAGLMPGSSGAGTASTTVPQSAFLAPVALSSSTGLTALSTTPAGGITNITMPGSTAAADQASTAAAVPQPPAAGMFAFGLLPATTQAAQAGGQPATASQPSMFPTASSNPPSSTPAAAAPFTFGLGNAAAATDPFKAPGPATAAMVNTSVVQATSIASNISSFMPASSTAAPGSTTFAPSTTPMFAPQQPAPNTAAAGAGTLASPFSNLGSFFVAPSAIPSTQPAAANTPIVHSAPSLNLTPQPSFTNASAPQPANGLANPQLSTVSSVFGPPHGSSGLLTSQPTLSNLLAPQASVTQSSTTSLFGPQPTASNTSSNASATQPPQGFSFGPQTSAAPQSTSIFGAGTTPSAGAFGNLANTQTANNSIFPSQNTSTPVFGAQPTPTPVFGAQPSTSSIFGAPSSTQQPSQAAAPATGMSFGQAPPQAAAQPNPFSGPTMFGTGFNPASTTAAPVNPFGKPATPAFGSTSFPQPAAAGAPVFGQSVPQMPSSPSAQANPFGSGTNLPFGSPLGAPAPAATGGSPPGGFAFGVNNAPAAGDMGGGFTVGANSDSRRRFRGRRNR